MYLWNKNWQLWISIKISYEHKLNWFISERKIKQVSCCHFGGSHRAMWSFCRISAFARNRDRSLREISRCIFRSLDSFDDRQLSPLANFFLYFISHRSKTIIVNYNLARIPLSFSSPLPTRALIARSHAWTRAKVLSPSSLLILLSTPIRAI